MPIGSRLPVSHPLPQLATPHHMPFHVFGEFAALEGVRRPIPIDDAEGEDLTRRAVQ